MKRRAFFQRIAQAAAIIALAPQIAFRAPRLRFDPLFAHQIEMSAMRVESFGLYDYIMANAPVEERRAVAGPKIDNRWKVSAAKISQPSPQALKELFG